MSGAPQEVAAELTGSVLAGRYRILQKLGEGAMGTVYLGEHLRIGRRDAIKVLRNALSTDRETIARFIRGARILSSIHHPNVCTIYDFSDTDDGLQFLAMELVSGESLKDVLDREGVLPLGRALPIAMQVASALQAAHDGDVVHRDLKPANIMIVQGKGGTDGVKVVDFDIAKGPREGEGAEVTRLGFVVGTPEYMSPEQLVGERLDGRSDLYSLGLVLFRMLTGVLPFRTTALQELMVERLTQPPLTLAEVRPEAEIPARLQQVLARTLARRADERYASAADLERDLAAVLAEVEGGAPAVAATSVSVAPPAPDPLPQTQIVAPTAAAASAGVSPTEGPPAARSRRITPLVIAAVVLLLGGGGGVWLLRSRTVQVPSPEALAGVVQASEAGLALVETPISTAGTGNAGTAEREPEGTARTPQTQVKEPLPAGERAPTGSTPAPTAERPPAEPSVSPAAALSPELHGAVLMRQLERLDDGVTGARDLRMIRDSALLVYNAGSALARDRANAAFVMANAWVAQKDSANVVLWLTRALELRPGYAPYQNLLDAYRRTAP